MNNHVTPVAEKSAESRSELLPCPFCGAVEGLRIIGGPKETGAGWTFVRCDMCDAEGPDPDSKVFWNDRASDATELLRTIIDRAEWNGRRQGWDIRCDLPAGTINAARKLLASKDAAQ